MLFFKNGIFNLISLFLATSLGPSSPIEMYSGRKWTFFKIFEIQIFMPIFEFSSKNWTFWCVYRPDYDKVHQTMIFYLLCWGSAWTGKSAFISNLPAHTHITRTARFRAENFKISKCSDSIIMILSWIYQVTLGQSFWTRIWHPHLTKKNYHDHVVFQKRHF